MTQGGSMTSIDYTLKKGNHDSPGAGRCACEAWVRAYLTESEAPDA